LAPAYGSNGSQTWKYLQKSINILLHWIAWYLGSITLIVIGRDSIIGMGEFAILFEGLISALNHRGIYFFYFKHLGHRDQETLGIFGYLVMI
jgi:hypothetical protein